MLLHNVWVEKLPKSLFFNIVWCLPFATFLRCDIRNLTFGANGGRQAARPTVHHGENAYPKVPRSDAFGVTAPEVALHPVTQRMPPKLTKPTPASLPPLLHPQRKCQSQVSHSPKSLIFHAPISKCKPQNSHFPRSSSFRNLSSNEVRYKFREREKVKITVPHKT